MAHLSLRTISVKQASDCVGRDNEHTLHLRLNTHTCSVIQ